MYVFGVHIQRKNDTLFVDLPHEDQRLAEHVTLNERVYTLEEECHWHPVPSVCMLVPFADQPRRPNDDHIGQE